MWTLNGFIAKFFHRKHNRLWVARIGLIEQAASGTSVAVDTNLRSCRLKLRSDCTHMEAIAEIEDHLRGTRSSAICDEEEPFQVGRHGII